MKNQMLIGMTLNLLTWYVPHTQFLQYIQITLDLCLAYFFCTKLYKHTKIALSGSDKMKDNIQCTVCCSNNQITLSVKYWN
jgi:carbon starvation protein CstA